MNLLFGFRPALANNPVADVQQFVSEFEAAYGTQHPRFLTCGYDEVQYQYTVIYSSTVLVYSQYTVVSQVMLMYCPLQALSKAREELQFLLVYVHSPAHRDAPQFCQDVLCSQEFMDFVAERMLMWGVGVNTQEGVS